jgi:hypothetical protein
LLEWQPGELPDLLADVERNENEYTELALEMMRNNGIDPARDPGMEIYRRQQRMLDQWQGLEQDRKRLREEIVSFQGTLKREVLKRWPAAAAAYSLGFKAFIVEELDAAQTFIMAQPEYLQLHRRQERFLDQDDRALQQRREHNQLQKIAHLLRLARLKADLKRDGPADLLERYRKLRACESAPF